MIEDFLRESRIAYFSMEIALRDEIPTYSGGLGVLAGDTLRSAADLSLPFVGVTLASRGGYFRQEIDGSGRQVEREDPWEPASWLSPLTPRWPSSSRFFVVIARLLAALLPSPFGFGEARRSFAKAAARAGCS